MRLGMRKRQKFCLPMMLIIFFILIVFCAKRMENALVSAAHSYANGVAVSAVSKSVYGVFKDIDMDFSHTDSTDRATLFHTDTVKVNMINSYILDHLRENISKSGDKTVKIPIGTVTGIAVFSGLGFKIPVKVYPVSCLDTDIRETFTDCGINQVRHSIYLSVDMEIGYSGYMFNTSEKLSVNIPVTDTVIIGDVPQYYGDVGADVNGR